MLIPSEADCDAASALAGWRDEPAPVAGRPRVALNMITSLDGRVAIDGRSGGLGSPADRELFHALRAQADAVMAGAGTVRVERYGPIIRDEAVREARRAAGLSAQPLAVIATRSLELDPTLPLLSDAGSHVIVTGAPTGDLVPTAARVDYIRTSSLERALRELHEHFGVQLLVCEGGPHLAGALFRAGLLDELFITLAARLVGGPSGPTFLADDGPAGAGVEMSLRLLLSSGDELFARYSVSRPGARRR
jgi:riboflavin-specific deaminase-like protein